MIGIPMTPEEYARRQVKLWLERGYEDDEIMNAIQRDWRDRGGLSLRDERLVIAAIAELRQLVAPAAEGEPRWRNWKEWSRADFERAVAWDKAHGGRGGKVRIAQRCFVHPSPLYRHWQAVAPGEPWPSGNKGPLNRRT